MTGSLTIQLVRMVEVRKEEPSESLVMTFGTEKYTSGPFLVLLF